MKPSQNINFWKYQGTGNDFIIIDNRTLQFNFESDTIRNICDRRFGIGADGLILLQNSKLSDFEMIYYNADGGIGTMCGNGGRCIVSFAKKMGIIGDFCIFSAADGLHEAKIDSSGFVELKMNDPKNLKINDFYFTLDSGSPHYIKFVDNLSEIDVPYEGKKIRYSEEFKKEGINVNFVEKLSTSQIKVHTYERGVENETFACGTGVTAAAVVFYLKHHDKSNGSKQILAEVKGGELLVKFDFLNGNFSNIWLCGPATFVFEGIITL